MVVAVGYGNRDVIDNITNRLYNILDPDSATQGDVVYSKLGRSSDDYSLVIYGFGLVLLAIMWFGSYLLTDEVKASSAAEDIGYTNVVVVDKTPIYPFSICSGSDNAKFTVTGTAPNGEERTVTVCAGIFKGGTVRSG